MWRSWGCRPGCRGAGDTPDSTWEFLIGGGDGIRERPVGRWEEFTADPQVAREVEGANTVGGYLDQTVVKWFDAEFFAMQLIEVEGVDPQQRLAMELTTPRADTSPPPPRRDVRSPIPAMSPTASSGAPSRNRPTPPRKLPATVTAPTKADPTSYSTPRPICVNAPEIARRHGPDQELQRGQRHQLVLPECPRRHHVHRGRRGRQNLTTQRTESRDSPSCSPLMSASGTPPSKSRSDTSEPPMGPSTSPTTNPLRAIANLIDYTTELAAQLSAE